MKKLFLAMLAGAIAVSSMLSVSAEVTIQDFSTDYNGGYNYATYPEKNPAKGNGYMYDITNVDDSAAVNADTAIWEAIAVQKDFAGFTDGTVVIESAFRVFGNGNVNDGVDIGLGPIILNLQDYDETNDTAADTAKFLWGMYVPSSQINGTQYSDCKKADGTTLFDWKKNNMQAINVNGTKIYTKSEIDLDNSTIQSYYRYSPAEEWRVVLEEPYDIAGGYINRLKVSVRIPGNKSAQFDYIKVYDKDDETDCPVNDEFNNGETWVDSGYSLVTAPNNKVTYTKDGKKYVKRVHETIGDNENALSATYPFGKSYSTGKVAIDFDYDPYFKKGAKAKGISAGIILRGDQGEVVKVFDGNDSAQAYLLLNDATDTDANRKYIGSGGPNGIGGSWGGVSLWQETTISSYRIVLNYDNGTLDFYKKTAGGVYQKRNREPIDIKTADGSARPVSQLIFNSWSYNSNPVDKIVYGNIHVFTLDEGKTVSDRVMFDENNTQITEAAPGQKVKIAVGAGMKSTDDKYSVDSAVTLAAALFGSDGIFKDVKYETKYIDYLEGLDSYSFNILEYTVPETAVSGDTIKVMVWDSFDSMTPYDTAITINVK